MHPIRAVSIVVVAASLLLMPRAPMAQAGHDAADVDHAVEMFNRGDQAGALGLVENVLAHSPEDQNALMRAAQFNFRMRNADVARGRLERLVKLTGNFYSAWELMVQVTQTQGDLVRRNEAIARLKIAINTAIDLDIRQRGDFIRDRIPSNRGDVLAIDYFTRGGSDFTRYQFYLGDPRTNPDKGLLLRTDESTTENWSQTALLPPEKQLFHLDMVDPAPAGGNSVAVYQFYVGEPSYDVVRAKVMEILRGDARPLSGEPGSLQGIVPR